jgi:putative serine protease PepD
MAALLMLLVVAAQDGTVSSRDFSPAAQTAALAAAVRVVNPAGSQAGSGAVIGKSGPLVYVLTAAHVVEGARQLEVRTYSAKSYPRPEAVYRSAEVVARSAADDLALVRFATGDTPPGLVPICPAGDAPAGGDFGALAVGCEGDKAPTCLPVRVIAKRRVRKAGDADVVWLWELDQALARGRSGGPLLDRQGRLIGVASLISGGRSYCGHVDAVHALLRRSGLRHLAEPGPK